MEADIRDRIIGTWKLVSTEQTMNDGASRPFPDYGPHAKGFLMYQSDGYMCAVLVNPDRPTWADPVQATTDDKLAAAEGALAYGGRYEIDVNLKQIIHFPEVSTNAEFVGSRQVRPYQFEGDRLTFSDAEKTDPSVSRWKIVWQKVRDEIG